MPLAGSMADQAKVDIPTVARKNQVVANIKRVLDAKESFLIVGHKDPDEDCVSSMVAFALIVSKVGKKATIVLGVNGDKHFSYLLNICRYNGIVIVRDDDLPRSDVLVLVDTPKPDMMDRCSLFEAMIKDPNIIKLELDHHLGADSRYFGDEGLRLVYEASSTCETIGFLALKLESDKRFMGRHQVDEFLTRNLVLAIVTGMISDSQMGRYLKTKRESWFYARFSVLFESMLEKKTRRGSGNFRSKEEVFNALVSLSSDEDACYRSMASHAVKAGRVFYVVLGETASASLFSAYGTETVITVAKALVDRLAEESGFVGLVGYYDDPELSDFIQFRMRRSQKFMELDLRTVLETMGVLNGGGHPGAVGFRLKRNEMHNLENAIENYISTLKRLIDEALEKTRGEGTTGTAKAGQ